MKSSPFRAFLNRNALILSMALGALCYPVSRLFMPLLPWMIFLMLFFTFCKVNPVDLRLRTWHWVVLAVQLGLSVGVYYAVFYLCQSLHCTPEQTQVLSQGIMVCIIMPTATAAPIIAGKLGGSIQNLTSFTLLSNISTALVVSAFFPVVTATDLSFWEDLWLILRHVGPLLLGPFFAAWLLRLGYNAVQRRRGSERTFRLSPTWTSMPFYLWVGTLVILMGDITYTLTTHTYNYFTLLGLCVGSLLACLVQFYLGKLIGSCFPAATIGVESHEEEINPAATAHDMRSVSKVTAGQAFGQKNTSLGVWMAQTYLNPLSAIGPAAYIVWQNLFNSFQLSHKAKQHPIHNC